MNLPKPKSRKIKYGCAVDEYNKLLTKQADFPAKNNVLRVISTI